MLQCAYALPSARTELEVSLFPLQCLLDIQTEDKKTAKVTKFVKNELLLINIGSTSTGGRVLSVKGDLAKIQLTSPACTEVGEKVALSRRIEKHWRLVGERAFCLFGLFVARGLMSCVQVGAACSAGRSWRWTRCRLQRWACFTCTQVATICSIRGVSHISSPRAQRGCIDPLPISVLQHEGMYDAIDESRKCYGAEQGCYTR